MRSHDLNMVTGQRRSLALSVQEITLKVFKDKRLIWTSFILNYISKLTFAAI